MSGGGAREETCEGERQAERTGRRSVKKEQKTTKTGAWIGGRKKADGMSSLWKTEHVPPF
jgi:hypothetical protein